MANPLIASLPPAPVRSDSPEVFTARANAFLSALSQLQGELNALGEWVSTTSAEVESDRLHALGSRNIATNARDVAVSAKDTAVSAKNTAVSAKETAVSASTAAQNSAASIIQDVNPTANTISKRNADGDVHARLFRSAFATQTSTPSTAVQVMMRNSVTDNGGRYISRTAFINYLGAAALHADALRIGGANIQLVKASGASETVNVGTLMASLAVYVQGNVVLAYYLNNNTFAPGAVTSGVNLKYLSSSSTYTSRGLTGSWRSLGSADSINGITAMKGVQLWRRI